MWNLFVTICQIKNSFEQIMRGFRFLSNENTSSLIVLCFQLHIFCHTFLWLAAEYFQPIADLAFRTNCTGSGDLRRRGVGQNGKHIHTFTLFEIHSFPLFEARWLLLFGPIGFLCNNSACSVQNLTFFVVCQIMTSTFSCNLLSVVFKISV